LISYILNFYNQLEVWRFRAREFYFDHFRWLGRSIYIFSGILSIVILIAEYGFYYPNEWKEFVRIIVFSLVSFFLFYEITSLLFTSHTYWEYIRHHKIEVFIMLMILLERVYEKEIIEFLFRYHITGNDATLIFLSTNQLLLIFANFARMLRLTKFYDVKQINPSLAFVSSFAFIVFIGVLFLHFPKAAKTPLKSIDIVFITFSATCVTGLSPISISESLTTTGQLILLTLIQVGGLGLMTLTSFFSIFLAGKASVSDTLVMKDLLSEKALDQVRDLLKQVALQTFGIELVGSILLYISIPNTLYNSEWEHVYFSLFHSISAFCNAGFSLFPKNLAGSEFQNAYGFLSTIMLLIVFGGLGFPVMRLILQRFERYRDRTFRWSVASLLVFFTSGFLWTIGTIAYLFLESDESLYGLNLGDRIFHSLFYSISTRTAGFNTLDLTSMGMAMTFFSLFLMWVGASPVSTGGGIKTTTLAIAFLNILNQIRGKQNLNIHNRFIAASTISRASATIVLSLFVIFSALFLLVNFEPFPFLDLAFEVVSAFGTVGLSTGITSELTFGSKITLCVVMFGGRIGILTLLVAFSKKAENFRVFYPEEYVVVG